MSVTVEQARRHLNVSDNTDDVLLQETIEAAEAYVSRWLDSPLSEMTVVPADLRQAVLMLVGHFYENREASLVGINAQVVPFGVREIIDQHRAWAF